MHQTSMTAVSAPFSRPSRLAAIDRLTLGYIAAATCILLAHLALWDSARPARWELGGLAGLHLLLATCACAAPLVRQRVAGTGRFLAEWYPLLLMAGLYATVGLINNPGSVREIGFDATVQQWDLAIFGRQISHDWIRAMPSPALSWMLHLSYLCFYPMIFVAPAGLWFTGRRDAARRAIFAIALSFFVCYLAFLLYPVAGPTYVWPWPDNAATRVWPARLVEQLLTHGDSWGSAFPSSHVAVAVTCAVYAWRGRRLLGAILAVPATGIVFAVVYGQIHYGTDAIAGLVVAGMIAAFGPRLCRGSRAYCEWTA